MAYGFYSCIFRVGSSSQDYNNLWSLFIMALVFISARIASNSRRAFARRRSGEEGKNLEDPIRTRTASSGISSRYCDVKINDITLNISLHTNSYKDERKKYSQTRPLHNSKPSKSLNIL